VSAVPATYSVAVVQPSADDVGTLSPVTSMRTLSEITDASSAVDGVEAKLLTAISD